MVYKTLNEWVIKTNILFLHKNKQNKVALLSQTSLNVLLYGSLDFSYDNTYVFSVVQDYILKNQAISNSTRQNM